MPSTLGIVASSNLRDDFVLEWDTSLGTNTVIIPLRGTVDCIVDWGDGTTDTYTTTGDKTHTYPAAGVYTMRLSGTLTQFGTGASRPQLTRCLSFGEVGLTSLLFGFRSCPNLVEVPTSLPMASSVTNLSGMFFGASSFNQGISGWDVSSVTLMNIVFANASSFDQDLGEWDVSSVTMMINMFFGIALSTTNYDSLLIGWSGLSVQPNVVFTGGNSEYSVGAATTARGVLTGAPNNWTISDGGQVA